MQWSPDGRRIILQPLQIRRHIPGEFIAPDSVGGPGIPPPASDQPIQRQAGAFGRFVVAGWNGHCRLRGSRRVSSRSAIYIANSDGTGLTFVTRGNDATWSPAG